MKSIAYNFAAPIAILIFFAAPAFARAATYYYNNVAADGNWGNTSNWWTDAGFTISGSVPTSADTAIVSASVSQNTGAAASVSVLTVNGNATFGISATASIGATFNNSTYHSAGTLTANTTFNNSSHNNAPLVGTGTFTGGTFNGSTISSDATFSGTSYNDTAGIVSGNATFSGTSNNKGTVSGNATFNSPSFNFGTGIVSGNATFNDAVNNGTVASATFNTTGNNNHIVTGNAIFNNTTYNVGSVGGTATFNNTSYNHTGTVTGIAYFYNTARNNGTLSSDAYFYNSSYNNLGTVAGKGYFFNTSYNDKTVSGNAVFADTTQNTINGNVVGNACFAIGASNNGVVSGSVSVCGVPAISAATANNLTSTAATLNAALISTGGDSVTEHGFAYGTDPFLSTVIATTTLGVQSSIGAFTSSVSSLTCATTYYVRGYATNIFGTGYTNIASFSTAACITGSPASNSNGGGRGYIGSVTNVEPAATANTSTDSHISDSADKGGGSSFQFLYTASSGTSSDEVRMLQKFLNSKGFFVSLDGPGSKDFETSYFGQKTKSALALFQKSVGIVPAMGYFGPITKNFVNHLILDSGK